MKRIDLPWWHSAWIYAGAIALALWIAGVAVVLWTFYSRRRAKRYVLGVMRREHGLNEAAKRRWRRARARRWWAYENLRRTKIELGMPLGPDDAA